MRKTLQIACLCVLGLAGKALSDQIAVSSFKYLNSNENSTIINPAEAQDLLNVDITPSGKSVKKRSGYGLYKTVFSPSSGVHGGFHAFDSTGNDVQIWASSVSVKGIVADGTPNTIVSSMTVNSTIDCADTQGSIYCVDSNRDFFIRTNGTTLTQWFTTPLGTMVESTPDRVVVAGVSGSPNTLFFSQSNTFTNFVTGVNATDAFNEVIAAPGSHITHIRWGCQKLLWWKDQSFGYFDFDDQYSAQVKTVSDNIGTVDNTSAIDPGGNIWFRGQDGHTYKYDCSGLTRETVDITPQIQSSGRRTTNSWTQTSQSDFESGSIIPTGYLSTAITPGSIVLSTQVAFSTGDTTANDFSIAGSLVNVDTFTFPGDVVLSSTWGVEAIDQSNEVFDNSAALDGNDLAQSFVTSGAASQIITAIAIECQRVGTAQTHTISIKSDSSNSPGATLVSASFPGSSCGTSSPAWVKISLADTSLSASTKYWIYLDKQGNPVNRTLWKIQGSGNVYASGDLWQNGFGILAGQDGTFREYMKVLNGYVTSGNLTSQIFDVGVTTSTYLWNWGIFNSSITPRGQVISFQTQTSTDTLGTWDSLVSASTGSALISSTKRYVRYKANFSTSDSTITPVLSSVSINTTSMSKSSGTYYSSVKNAPNLTAWSTFNPTTSGEGTQTFYTRSSTSSFTILSSTPSWVLQTSNAQVAASTGTYFQVSDTFTITTATQTPTLNDFTFNWFEGSASDQAYMLYFDNAIWESVSYGVGISTNNYIFRYDLINDGWGLYYFGAGGMLIQNNRLFFGDVNNGNVYQFGSGASDNGTAINAFWKSKDFTGSDPFLQNSLTNIDVFAKKDTGTTLTSTYTVDTTSSTAYSIVLSTSNAIVQSRKLLPSGKLGYTFNFKLGDSSTSSQWEILGIRMGYTTNPYRPTP